ncbi:MAG: sodium:solute symporter family protein [Planctomycetota bacterium]|nr:sodium:solute symporter family protein [Planctomycetota bacterium]
MDKIDPAALEILRQTNFGTVDWVIVICYPMISLVIGLIVRKYIKNMKDFVTAGQGLGTCLGIATLTGTELGLITVMYSAEKGFKSGFSAFHIALAVGIVTFIVGITGFLIYRLRAMGVLTIPSYYRQRFGRKTQILGGIMMAFAGILNMGLFLKVGAMFLVGITGMDPTSHALEMVMGFLIALVLLYTCLGGMISVVLSDYLQFVVLSIGMVVTTVLAVVKLGWNDIFTVVYEVKGTAGFNPMVGESGFGIEYIVWMCCMGLVGCAVWPTSVARALAADSPETVKKQFTWASLSYTIRFLVPYFWGICAFVFIYTQSDALKHLFVAQDDGEPILNNLYAMPVFLGQILPPVVIGLISAGMIAAFMSTHDSYLLCWSSVLTEDIVAPLCNDKISPKVRVWLTRMFIVLIGVYVFWWGIFYKGSDDIWDYMAVTGGIYSSGALALLACGLYWKRASSTGAVLALFAGSSAVIGLSPVQNGFGWCLTKLGGLSVELWNFFTYLPGVTYESQYPGELVLEISAARVSLFSFSTTFIVLIVGSLLFPDRERRLTSESE